MPNEEIPSNEGEGSVVMDMRFKGHQSFFIRKGWLSKGLKAVKDTDAIFMPSNSKSAMDELGIGSNQVAAMRYWLETTELIKKQSNLHEITELGKVVLKHDPYMEEMGTLWALHCNIASNRANATAWFYLFNVYSGNIFSKEAFSRGISKFIQGNGNGKEIAQSSIESDLSCIVNTYIPHEVLTGKRESPESVIDSPLGELRLIAVEGKGTNRQYRKMPAVPLVLPNSMILYAISKMDGSKGELKIENLLNEPCSPGRLFNLDSISLLTKLYELQDSGMLHITRTAGLDVVRLDNPTEKSHECLEAYYRAIA